jgi:hypothetical protein
MKIFLDCDQPEIVGDEVWRGGIQLRIENRVPVLVVREWHPEGQFGALDDPLYQITISAIGKEGDTYLIEPKDVKKIRSAIIKPVARLVSGISTKLGDGEPVRMNDLTPRAQAALILLQKKFANYPNKFKRVT